MDRKQVNVAESVALHHAFMALGTVHMASGYSLNAPHNPSGKAILARFDRLYTAIQTAADRLRASAGGE